MDNDATSPAAARRREEAIQFDPLESLPPAFERR